MKEVQAQTKNRTLCLSSLILLQTFIKAVTTDCCSMFA